MKQKLLNVFFFLESKKELFKKTLSKEVNLKTLKKIPRYKVISVFFFLLFVSFSSNLQAQILVNPASFCAGTSPVVSISVNITGGVSEYTVSYRIGAGAPIIKTKYIRGTPISVPTPIANTTYTIVSVSDQNGTIIPTTGSATVTVLPKPAFPIIDADGPTTFCPGGSVVLKPRVSATTYRWTTPQGILTTQNITASKAGSYSLQVTNASGCTSINSIATTITIVPLATPVIDKIAPPNCLLATGSVTLSGLPATGTWTINPGGITGTGTTTTLSGLNIGTHKFTVTNQNGCVSAPTSDIVMNMESAPTQTPVLNAQINGCKASFTQTWQPVTAATGYRLDVATDPDFTTFLPGYQDKELENITEETISGITLGTTYFVRLKAINSCGSTPYSSPITVSPITTTYENGLWSNGLPNSTKSIVFNSSYNVETDMNGCSCQVNAGANVTVASGITLKLQNGLNVVTPGTLTFENSSSLVQVNNVPNSGKINYIRITPPIRQADYVYWSTPVTPQTLVGVSQDLTLSDKYYMYGGTGVSWIGVPKTTVMVVGKGYIIRGPQNSSNTVGVPYTATFTGVPNNGTIRTNEPFAGAKSFLIGNPYPSALDADKFILGNSALKGTLHFWTHNTPVVLVGAYKYNADDYATYNLTGGTGTGAKASTGDPSKPETNSTIPSGKIAAGQSFMAPFVSSDQITFTNDMRVGGAENSQFFRPGKASKATAVEKHRVWLNFTNTEGAFKQLLVGYIQGATNNFETRYDGLTLDANKYVDFYSMDDTHKFAIQGRGLPFLNTDIVPLGYRSTIAGDFTISIDQVDGNLVNQAIYLEDKLNNTYVDLRCKNYTFNTATGTFDNRFVLHYNNPENKQFVQSPVATEQVLLDCSQTSYIQQWTAAKDAKGYRLDVATDAGFTNFLSGYQAKELSTVTSDTITGITPGVSYYVRVRAFNDCGESLNSNVVTVDPIATTYENGVWSNGVPDGSKSVVFNSDYSIDADMSACSFKVNSGVNVSVQEGVVLKLENGLTVAQEGTLTFENNASLVQVNESPNTGNIVYKRTAAPMKILDFNYWSSPVMGQTLNALSPNTSSDKYFSFDNGKWVIENGNTQMIPAKGYTIRAPKAGTAPNGEVVTFPYAQPVQFIGVPNNGHQEFVSDATGLSNLIGNPYPSAIDADSFLDSNSEVLAGTIYLWTRHTSYFQNIYDSDDYASYNALGGIATVASDLKPTGKIAAGQSFFIESLNSGKVTFNNSMRVSGQNTQFFKSGKTNKTASVEKHRFWLNLTNKQGTFKQILIGYITGATNDYDNRFDGKSWNGNSFVDFYSINSDSNLSIEGRALPFENTDTVPLGYKSLIGGTFSVSIDQVDGLFTDQAIYLEDKSKKVYHNLKEGPYSFTTFGGTYNNRFVVHYQNAQNTVPSAGPNKTIVSIKNSQIAVNSSNQKIQRVVVYDLNGRIVFEKNDIRSTSMLTDKLIIRKQILVVKTTFENGKTNTDLTIF